MQSDKPNSLFSRLLKKNSLIWALFYKSKGSIYWKIKARSRLISIFKWEACRHGGFWCIRRLVLSATKSLLYLSCDIKFPILKLILAQTKVSENTKCLQLNAKWSWILNLKQMPHDQLKRWGIKPIFTSWSF